MQPDPAPLRIVFIRSDQYNFIRQEVPSVMIDIGYLASSPEAQVLKDWRTLRYHARRTIQIKPVDLAAAAGCEELIRTLTIEVANDPARPYWKDDSFRRYASAR